MLCVGETASFEPQGSLKHRGPDGTGLYAQGSIGIAMSRLAIIAVSGGKMRADGQSASVLPAPVGHLNLAPCSGSDFASQKQAWPPIILNKWGER